MDTKELIDEVVSLPVEDRALLADTLLKSLNHPDAEIDRKWIALAKQRLDELRAGSVEAVPGVEVFDRISDRFGK